MKSKLRKSLIEKNFVFTLDTLLQDFRNPRIILNQIVCLKVLVAFT